MNESPNAPAAAPVELSVVTTLYCSAPYLREFCQRVSAAARRLGSSYEIILVNDASPDDSLEVALSLFQQDQHLRVIDLARNYQHHRAMMAGMMAARGDWVFKIDCDLEDRPEWLVDFAAVRDEDPSIDFVYGVQEVRRGNFFQRLVGESFYRLFNWLSYTQIPHNTVSALLMSRRFVDALTAHRERTVYMAGLMAETGFRKHGVPVSKARNRTSTYTLRKRFRLLVAAVTSFSDKPLFLIAYLGGFMLLLSAAAGGVVVWRAVWSGGPIAAWPLLLATVWFVGGLVLSCLGVIGIYLSKVLREVQQRPYAIVRESYEHPPPSRHGSVPRVRITESKAVGDA